jgi:23S rRNA (adenine2503-C2)-methyltransferase
MTGKQGIQANLSAAEILNQVYSLPQFEQLTNIVFMGMGEPLDNLEEVLKACNVLTSDWGLAFSPRRITISTVGILSNLPKLLEESQCHVAISLHTPFADEREKIMPVQKSNKMDSIIQLLHKYEWRGQRRLSFEYIMFHGINDSENHLKALISLLKGLFCRVNLIRYHEIPLLPFKPSSNERMMQFRDTLTEKNVIATIRRSRGQDIFAACGMLFYENSPDSQKMQ